MNYTPPILITSSVKVSTPVTKLRNQEERINLTIKALGKWVQSDNNFKIIVCDGSGVDFSKQIYLKYPDANIEFLTFKNNSLLVRKYGSGYGEGEIINYALLHSQLLQKEPSFVKCTSKLYVENFREILNCYNGELICQCTFSNVRILRSFFNTYAKEKIKLLSIDTRFYIINKKIYLNFFSQAYIKVRHSKTYYLEHSFLDAAIKSNLRHFISDFAFKITGVSGTLHKEYRKIGLLRFLKIKMNFSLIKSVKKFEKLFIA
ncbi:hypothetical protein MCEET85_00910 [Candidatus Methylopumilus planktonicus]|uniref:hypothetical protein n=1 Tax=Candidatus Methylopumilus planktonicus TaxID=1581557 RepID=UPI003BEEF147